MILFLLGFSLCLNFILIILALFIYKKIVPVFKSTSFDIDNFDIGNLNV